MYNRIFLDGFNLVFIKTNRLFFLLVTFFFGVLLNVILSFIYFDLLNIDLAEENDSLLCIPIKMRLILTLFIAPFIETALFQYMPIVLTLKTLLNINMISVYSKRHYHAVVVFSSLLFASIHTFSIVYFFVALIMGLYFGYITIISEFVRDKKVNVFISVGLTHLIINSMPIIFS